MGHVEPVACFDNDDTDKCRTGKRADSQAHVKSDIAVARTEIDEVAEAHGDDATHGDNRQESARYAEDGRETHSRDGSSYGKLPILVMRNHREVFHEVVDAAHLNGEAMPNAWQAP